MEQDKEIARSEQPETDRKPYARPELVKHGNVENLTHQVPNGPSGPIDV